MSNWTCKSCGGTYPDGQPDGTTYFHACAPSPPDLNGVQLERPNKRDENITLDRRGQVTGLTAAGAGVTPVGPNVLTQPKWITDLQAAIAKRSQ